MGLVYSKSKTCTAKQQVYAILVKTHEPSLATFCPDHIVSTTTPLDS